MNPLSLTAKVRLTVSDPDMQLLLDTAKAYTTACNLVSEWIFHSHSLTHRTVHDALYLKLRNDLGLKSQMAESVFRTVIARFCNHAYWLQYPCSAKHSPLSERQLLKKAGKNHIKL